MYPAEQLRIQREAVSQLASCRDRAIHIPTAPAVLTPPPAVDVAVKTEADAVDGDGSEEDPRQYQLVLPPWDCPVLTVVENGAVFSAPLEWLSKYCNAS